MINTVDGSEILPFFVFRGRKMISSHNSINCHYQWTFPPDHAPDYAQAMIQAELSLLKGLSDCDPRKLRKNMMHQWLIINNQVKCRQSWMGTMLLIFSVPLTIQDMLVSHRRSLMNNVSTHAFKEPILQNIIHSVLYIEMATKHMWFFQITKEKITGVLVGWNCSSTFVFVLENLSPFALRVAKRTPFTLTMIPMKLCWILGLRGPPTCKLCAWNG